jgi:glycosyltransferase involved in cell wall biosynthesis
MVSDLPSMPRGGVYGPIVGISTDVIDAIGPKGGLDGIGIYTEALFGHLAKSGVTPKSVASPRPGRINHAKARRPDLTFDLPLPVAISFGALAHVRTFGSARVESAIDLYHATNYMVPRLARTPVVATVYDAIPLAQPQWANQRLRGLKNWLLRNSVRNADRVIAISEAGREEIISHYRVARERTRVIPLGIDEEWFSPQDADVTAQILKKRNLDRGYFLFVGTLQPRKNIGMLLDAYERLPAKLRAERQLVIVGKYGWNAEDVRARLEGGLSSGRCVWLNYVPRDELRHIYAAAGAFVFPSLAEGFGLPVLEALASGLPVIASDLPALREVGGAHALYVRPEDSTALTDAMMAVGAVDPAANGHDERRRAHAAHFSWSVCAARTVDVYRELW